MIRDAAYDALPKASRAELHERFANWLEGSAADLPELDEIAGWHLEQAVHYARELGRVAEPRLIDRAAQRLRAAGRRAGERSDTAAATNLLDRALALAGEDGSLGASIAVELAEQLVEAGDYDRVHELLVIGERDPELAGLVALGRFDWALRAQPREAVGTIESLLPGVLEEFERRGNEHGIARAHMAWSWAHWLKSRATPAAEHAILSAEHARRAGDEGLRSRALGHYLGTLSFGDADTKAITAEVDRIEREASGAYLAAWLDLAHGELADLAGHFDEGTRLAQRSVDALLELGLLTLAGAAYQNVARMRQRAGDLEGALADLQRGDQMLADLGEHSYRSTTQAMLAELHEQLGDRAAALAAIDLAEKLGAPEDVINYAFTHSVRARLALSGRDFVGAERWATSAVDYAYRTDFLWIRAGTKTTLACVLAESGRTGAAAEELHAARGLYRAKGDVPAAANVDALLAAL